MSKRVNFSEYEKQILLTYVKEYAHIIEDLKICEFFPGCFQWLNRLGAKSRIVPMSSPLPTFTTPHPLLLRLWFILHFITVPIHLRRLFSIFIT